jgi:hypothetical protein
MLTLDQILAVAVLCGLVHLICIAVLSAMITGRIRVQLAMSDKAQDLD